MKGIRTIIGLMLLSVMVIAADGDCALASAGKVNKTADWNESISRTKKENKYKPGWLKKNGKHYWVKKDGTVLKESGMKKLGGSWYYILKDGSRAEGFRKSGEKLYYFKKKTGNRFEEKGFAKIDGKQYFFKKDHSAAAGYTKIGKKFYLFSEKGVLYTADKEEKDTLYYMNEDSSVRAFKRGGTYYQADGKEMSKLDAYDFETLQTAKKIAAQITTDSMSREEKLKACFIWVMKKSYIEKRRYTIAPGWIPLYANDHFHGRGSTCEGDAAAFAYLAVAIGYKDVFVCKDAKDSNSHAWTEIGGLAYDPLFAQNRGFNKHYAARYKTTYRLYPEVHIRMS